MTHEDYFFNCSREYIDSINPTLYDELTSAIASFPKRATSSDCHVTNPLVWSI